MATVTPATGVLAADWTLVGWNDLGMHCIDADYSVFSLLPPFNNVHAQLIDPQGRLVSDPDALGIHVTYEAVADPDGSINTTSAGKTNFWEYVLDLFGADVSVDVGLTGQKMPGAGNEPQPMEFDPGAGWFTAEGIPLTPYDDEQHKNTYPLMRLVARDASGVLATTDIVLPVSDETDCSSCHASESSAAARPFAGWVFDPDPQRDVRLNILRLHDEREVGRPLFDDALATLGFNPDGLYATAVSDGRSILCAGCHPSNALPGSGLNDNTPLTLAVHRRMAYVLDPDTGLLLNDAENRSACYRCHPGSVTRCLRGAMGAAVAADGTLAMQCQSCHGAMVDVGSPDRDGWLDEPRCQSCHTGTAVINNGQIRYTSVFEPGGQTRVAVDQTFATNPDTPAPGLSLYRFSAGHGGLQCEACHGSTHAVFPSSHRNDNIQSVQIQGHVGVLAECTACHASSPQTIDGGPHGMHPVGAVWVREHGDFAEEGNTQGCRSCHGTDYRGTVRSRAKGDRELHTDFGTKIFWRGFRVGCYTCHLGPNSEAGNPNHAPVAENTSASTVAATPIDIPLSASDADGDGLVLRVVSQPQRGTVGLSGILARYFPEAGFAGDDSFTFAANDGSTDSNLAVVALTVGELPPTVTPTPTSTPTIVPTPTPSPVPASALSNAIGEAVTEIPLADAGGFPDAGTIRIGDEVISYTGRSGDVLIGASRGADGTTPAAHAAGASIRLVGFATDGNCDGSRTAADLISLARRVAAGSAGVCGADANGDQTLDDADVRQTIGAIFGAAFAPMGAARGLS